jgi:alpha-glucosidase
MRIRPGAIIPAGPVAQFDDMKPIPMVTLVVALDATGGAVGRLYEDAGDGFGYKSGDYLLSTYVAKREGNTVTVSLAGAEGRLARPERRQVLVRLVLPDRVIENRGFDGQPVKLTVPR